MQPALAIVPPSTETLAERVQRLTAEASETARLHVASFDAAMTSLADLAAEIADGGNAYKPGVREIARQIHEDLEARVQVLRGIVARSNR